MFKLLVMKNGRDSGHGVVKAKKIMIMRGIREKIKLISFKLIMMLKKQEYCHPSEIRV